MNCENNKWHGVAKFFLCFVGLFVHISFSHGTNRAKGRLMFQCPSVEMSEYLFYTYMFIVGVV